MTAFNAAAAVGLVLAKSQFTNYCKVPDGLGGFDLRALAAAGTSRRRPAPPRTQCTGATATATVLSPVFLLAGRLAFEISSP